MAAADEPMMAVPTHGKVFEPVLQNPGETEVWTEEEPVDPLTQGFGTNPFMPETMPLYNPMNPFQSPFAPRPSVFGGG